MNFYSIHFTSTRSFFLDVTVRDIVLKKKRQRRIFFIFCLRHFIDVQFKHTLYLPSILLSFLCMFNIVLMSVIHPRYENNYEIRCLCFYPIKKGKEDWKRRRDVLNCSHCCLYDLRAKKVCIIVLVHTRNGCNKNC